MNRSTICFCTALLIFNNYSYAFEETPWASNEKTKFTPKIHHPNIAGITLFAENPDIVTPIGIAVAPDGRVFVQENHTHKRNSSYRGPETDRILIFEDTNQDGVADKRSIFYEGHVFSTDLLFGPDGHLYVSTRWFVGRFRDAATKQKADGEPEKLVICETEGDYPHNGVGGLAIDPAQPDWLAFGFGENLGADYAFLGSDGIRISGGGEGGSTYRCRTDGSQLTRQSTGHWNAFGMAYDFQGNLFSTDNDPNATPPNRLLHVVPGADFGYEYRYGRSGRHPLVCWYGENPGTLGMVGALGEAACGLIPHGPGQLLSASWTDNRVDIHELKPKGASFAVKREPFITGPDDFRPVHFSYSADGKYLYFTDWVKLSYPVHGYGRIWRVEFKQPVTLKPSTHRLKQRQFSTAEALAHLGNQDAYVRTAAMHVLSQHPEAMKDYPWQSQASPIARAHYAVTQKRIAPKEHATILPLLLQDTNQRVRFVGIKWIADEALAEYRPQLEELLNRADLTRLDLRAVVAALARISGDSNKEFSPDAKMLELAVDETKLPRLRAMALKSVNIGDKKLTVDVLASLAQMKHQAIKREAVRLLAMHPDVAKGSILSQIAADDSLDENLRADAIAGLASVAASHQDLLETLFKEENGITSDEAFRTMVSAGLAMRKLKGKPPIDDLPAWESLVDDLSGKADKDIGRRLFFHAKLGGCYNCHAMNGRGYQIGPDLTTIKNQSGITRNWLLEHIVNPNSEMAPYYRPQQLVTIEGKVLVGLIAGREGKKQGYVGSDGVIFYVDKEDVEERRELPTSIMPNGLLDKMTAAEIRDLLAYLLQGGDG